MINVYWAFLPVVEPADDEQTQHGRNNKRSNSKIIRWDPEPHIFSFVLLAELLHIERLGGLG
jgi:hypothetical protein